MPLASVAPVEVVLQPAKARAAARIPAKYFFCTALILDTPKAKVQMLELVSSLTLFFFALRRPPGPKIKTNIRTILRATGLNPPAKNGTQTKANLRLQPATSGGGSKPSKHGFPFGQPCRPGESIGPNLKPKLRTDAAGNMKADIRCAELGFRLIHFTRNLGTIRFTAQSVRLGSALRGMRFGHHHREPHKVNPTPNQEPQGYAAHVLSLVFIFRQDLYPGRASPQI